MIRFSKEKVLLLHQLIAQETGGSIGLRDESLLESALEAAFSGFGGVEFYQSKDTNQTLLFLREGQGFLCFCKKRYIKVRNSFQISHNNYINKFSPRSST